MKLAWFWWLAIFALICVVTYYVLKLTVWMVVGPFLLLFTTLAFLYHMIKPVTSEMTS